MSMLRVYMLSYEKEKISSEQYLYELPFKISKIIFNYYTCLDGTYDNICYET